MDIDEINRLQAQIDALQAQVESMRAEAEPERASRRGMLKLAAGAAAGAVAGGMMLGANPALAGSTNETQDIMYYTTTPTRVYDSRWTVAGSGLSSSNLGRLSPNSERTIAVTRGRNESGAVTNSQFLPEAQGGFNSRFVRGITYNLTATGGTGVNFLSISSASVTSRPTASAINYSANQNIANGGVTRVQWDGSLRLGVGDYQIKVWNGDDVGSVHFIVDITGFWWNSVTGPASPWSLA